ATYYNTGNSSVALDQFQNIYLFGSTSDTNIATVGAYQTLYGGGDDAFIAKFGTKEKYDAGILSIQNQGFNNCSDSGNIKLQLVNYGDTDLDSVNIFLAINGKLQKQIYWKGKLAPDSFATVNFGNLIFNKQSDTISAWTSMPDGFKDSVPDNDTSEVSITLNSYPYAITGSNRSVCKGNSTPIGSPPVSGHTYSWLSIPSGFTSTLSNPFVSPLTTTTYYLTENVGNVGCRIIDSVKVTVNPLPPQIKSSPVSVCAGDSVSIGANATAGNTYQWSSTPPGFVDSISKISIRPKDSAIYYLTETISSTGCQTKDSFILDVHLLPLAFTTFNQDICLGDSLAIGSAAVPSDA